MAGQYAAPWSFSGSANRIGTWAGDASATKNAGLKVLIWFVAVFAIVMAWSFIMSWYMLIMMFFVFVVPFRLLRRGQRQRKAQTRAIQNITRSLRDRR